MTLKRLFLAAAIALALLAAWQMGLFNLLSLDALKAQRGAIDARYAAEPLLVIALFFIAYVAVTAFSIPGAAVMTLAGGAIFGLTRGAVIISFASTIGATLAFLSSRYVLRDWVQSRFAARLGAINSGVERDGAFYLFSLRLVPVVPFFLINLAMGLTPIRTWTYYWVSQVGMLLGTLVYVNAGTQLAHVEQLSDIASPTLLASFTALALVPWVAKWLLRQVAARRG
ncbi:MAG: TVP38/TMEM64 family protein [Sphingopyxis sp.]